MPDKQNDNKFMAMLERRGIVRKSDSENNQPSTTPGDTTARPDADIRAMFNPPADNAPKVTPAARQPIPGLSAPVIPSERQQPAEREAPPKPMHGQTVQARSVERMETAPPWSADTTPSEQPVPADIPKMEPPKPVDIPKMEPPKLADIPRVEPPLSVVIPAVKPPKPVDIPRVEPPQFDEIPKEAPYMPVNIARVEPPMPVDIPKPDQFSAGLASMDDSMSRDKPAAAVGEYIVPETVQQPVVEEYTNRYLDIEELYEALSLQSKRTDTIFLVEEYLKTLPDSLPDDSRREIVRRIVSASGFDYDLLMGDGVLRVKMLKDYAERFARHTDEYIAARQSELDELDQQMVRVRRLIENRKGLHKRQFFAIEAEAQRLKEILTFISG